MTNTHDLTFSPTLPDFFESLSSEDLTVISGSNNSGKSLVLKNLKLVLGASAHMVGAARFYHIYHLSTGLRDPNQLQQWEQQFRTNFYQPEFNYEQNYIDLNQILLGLNDTDRERFFHLVGDLLGSEITLQRVMPDNELSPRYIDIDGRNMSTASTGTRLLMTLVGICMDNRFETMLIDEPELGLSPRVQHALARFLQDPDERKKHFPHLRKVVIATHSHLFLNRRNIRSNYAVAKMGSDVTIDQVEDVAGFHRLQFNLLGNSLEDLFLPAAVVVVEGPTDLSYIDRVFRLRLPDRRITVVDSNGDPKARVAALKATLGDLQKSPFRDRLFVVMDAKHTYSDTEALKRLGVLETNIVIWENNGIEYVYPPDVLEEVYSSSALDQLSIEGDNISLNGITRRKIELRDLVLAALGAETPLPDEFTSKLLDPLVAAID
jgi:predicted ATPase